ncbi:hypothetical protein [Chamaesiphon polymorphus]|uniref:Uncharacterized protein n=1 Tax=Chamaesiphon polymorphus CCALA 037 TaxID=2107692 RepID=A0A2T1GFI7_9CYAN|nr:hypothetical protein [Chamaesiphon polymorphus]PSB56349.1 hypothetical protein C7B77_12210 [Chamaesiphon polymorphus CCALA 037]
MKYIAIASRSIFYLALLVTTSVRAESVAHKNVVLITQNPQTVTTKITPFVLVSLAYQGQYRSQGIPGFASLISAYRFGTITAKDVVKAAILAKELTPDVLTDRDYLSAVDLQLFALDQPD